MIAYLQGKLVEAQPTYVIMDVNGVGYHIQIPVSSYDRLPEPGKSFTILTHLAIREDAHILYGFMSQNERELFRLLVTDGQRYRPQDCHEPSERNDSHHVSRRGGQQ